MTTLQSFVKKLNPLGIYDIQEGSNIYAELSAYAYALDRHRDNMEAVLRECFISTAEGYGIEIREKVFGNVRENYTPEQRREMLKLRRGLGNGDYTLEGFDRFMRSLGADSYNLHEMNLSYEVSVTINNSFNSTDAKWAENQIKLIMPAHLITHVYYGGALFSQIDSANMTYADFDSQNSTWTQLDNN